MWRRWSCQWASLLTLTVIALGCPGSKPGTNPAPRLDIGTPSAKIDVPQVVPVDFAQRVAATKAFDQWGPGALGAPLMCCDVQEDLVAYMFPYAIGADVFPSHEEILARIEPWRRPSTEGLEAMSAAQKAEMAAALEMRAKQAVSRDLGDAGPLRAADPPETFVTDVSARKYAQEKSVGAGDFGTVVVSARFDLIPVPLYMHYLPPYFAQGDQAAERARSALADDSAAMTRLFFLGRAGQYFKFSSGTDDTLIHAYTLELESAEEVLGAPSTAGAVKSRVPDDIARLAADEWARLKKEVQ